MIQGALTALPEEVLLGPGFLFTRNTLFGVTRGGLTFAPQRAQRNVPFDGKMAPIQGLHWDTSVDPILSGAFLQYRFPTVPAVVGDEDIEVFRQDFGDYADDDAFLADWVEGSGGAATMTWNLDNTHVVSGEFISAHVHVEGTANVGDIYAVTHTLTGLRPSASYTFKRQVWATEIVAGLPANQWNTLTSTVTTDSSGAVDLVLRFTTPGGGSFDVHIWFGDVHLLGHPFSPATTAVLYEPGSRGASGSGNVTTAYTMQQHAAAFSAGDYLEHLRWVFPWPEGGFVQIRFPLAFIRRYQVMTTRETEAAIHTVIEGVRSLDGAASDPGTVPWVIERLSAFS